MPISERDRLKLYDRLGQVLGPEDAGRLMELLPPAGWDDIATKDEVRVQGTALRGEMAELRSELRGELAELRSDLTAQLATMQRTILMANTAFILTVWISLLVAG